MKDAGLSDIFSSNRGVRRLGRDRVLQVLKNEGGSLAPKNLMKIGYNSTRLRAGGDASEQLVRNIFRRVSSANNLSADKTRTVGFINAGYHNLSCTHEWNFELLHKGNVLNIVDAYDGSRYKVATRIGNDIAYDSEGLRHLSNELRHYNLNSIRFYAPSLSSINVDNMAEVLIGRN